MAYFDNAATTFPKPECVYRAMDSFNRSCSGSYGRGQHKNAISVGSLVGDTRLRIAHLLHCSARPVAFTPSATIALNIVIAGIIEKGAVNVYISPFEHNAVTRTLHHFEQKNKINVRQLAVDGDMTYNREKIRYQFDECKPDLVIVSHVSNVIGLISPVEDIFTIAKKHSAFTVADLSQSAGLVDFDAGKEYVDFAVFAGHKTLLGPTGISGFVMKPDMTLPALIFGGTGFESANQDMPNSIPERFEPGTQNAVGIAGLNASLKWIEDKGTSELMKSEQANREHLIDILSEYSFIKLVGINPQQKYTGIVSCLLDGISSDSASTIFDERGVSVRTGLQCAPFAHKFLGTFPSGTVRFSVSPLTSEADFAELEKALNSIAEEY